MKNKTRFVTAILLSLVIFITLGCQLASQAFSTPMPDFLSTPAGTPTLKPTLSPTPGPDISSAILRLDDLPSGFEEINLEEIGMTLDDFSNETFQPEEAFLFINMRNFQMVFGFNFLLIENLDRAAFDLGMSQPERTLPALVDGMGPENVQDEKILDGIEDIGDVQIGMTMLANMEDVPVQVDILMFRRDIIGAMLMSMVLEGHSPGITIHELGLKLDQHIQESLQTTK